MALYTIVYEFTPERQKELIEKHNEKPFNPMTNKEYFWYIKQEFTSNSLYSTKDYNDAIRNLHLTILEKENSNQIIKRYIKCDHLGKELKVIKSFNEILSITKEVLEVINIE